MQKSILSRFARDKKTPHERLCDYYVNKAHSMGLKTVKNNKKNTGIKKYSNYELLCQILKTI